MKTLLQKLDYEKIRINWNKNPIPMKLFLSFLTVEVVRSTDHLGSSTGWTQLSNKEHKLIIAGGKLQDGEYLDRLEYGVKLHNSFNNWVNPFFLFPIMTQEGKDFFMNYYKDEITEVINKQKNIVAWTKEKLKQEKDELVSLQAELAELKIRT